MTELDPERKHRRSVRLAGYDYGSPGAYFVTICTHGRECIFNGPKFGDVVEATWRGISFHFPNVRSDEFVVMPNHVHGIVWILEANVVGAQHAAPLPAVAGLAGRHAAPLRSVAPGSLGAIVRSFKSAVTKRLNEILGSPRALVWQRNYYERVIRNEGELRRVREYVRLNPLRWDFDCENPQRVLNAAYDSEWGWLEGAACCAPTGGSGGRR